MSNMAGNGPGPAGEVSPVGNALSCRPETCQQTASHLALTRRHEQRPYDPVAPDIGSVDARRFVPALGNHGGQLCLRGPTGGDVALQQGHTCNVRSLCVFFPQPVKDESSSVRRPFNHSQNFNCSLALGELGHEQWRFLKKRLSAAVNLSNIQGVWPSVLPGINNYCVP